MRSDQENSSSQLKINVIDRFSISKEVGNPPCTCFDMELCPSLFQRETVRSGKVGPEMGSSLQQANEQLAGTCTSRLGSDTDNIQW